MPNTWSLSSSGRIRPLIAFVVCLAAMVLAADLAGAQSGRRTPKQRESQGVQPPAEPETPPAETKTKPEEKPRTNIVVARENTITMGFAHLSDLMLRGCADRLKESTSLSVTIGKDMNRGEASKTAKASADTYVVVLRLEEDAYNRRNRMDEITIDYALFAPATGKVASSGRVYLRPYRRTVGGVGVPLPIPQGREPAELYIRQAGADVADRVLSALGLPAPQRR